MIHVEFGVLRKKASNFSYVIMYKSAFLNSSLSISWSPTACIIFKVRDFVRDLFGKDPTLEVNPDECVALGAAIAASEGVGRVTFKNTKSLGVELHDGSFSVIIQKGMILPTQGSEMYTTVQDNQRAVKFPIYQGEDPVAISNELLGEIIIDEIRSAPAGMPQIDVSFDINTEGIVEVTARDRDAGREVHATVESALMSNEEKLLAAKRMQELGKQIE